MLITLVTEARHQGAPVVFRGDGFSGSATWLGSAKEVGALVDVELQIRDEVDWDDIVAGHEGASTVGRDDEEGLLIGAVEDLDQDGVLTLRIADGVVLIDTTGEPPLEVVGRTVRMVVRDVEIVPTGV